MFCLGQYSLLVIRTVLFCFFISRLNWRIKRNKLFPNEKRKKNTKISNQTIFLFTYLFGLNLNKKKCLRLREIFNWHLALLNDDGQSYCCLVHQSISFKNVWSMFFPHCSLFPLFSNLVWSCFCSVRSIHQSKCLENGQIKHFPLPADAGLINI